jgi:hypothetical protein
VGTFPITSDAGMGPSEWQKWGRGISGPDAVVWGLGVAVVGALKVRIGPGMARIGGFVWENPANLDVDVPANLNSGQNRTDSLFLRLQYNPATAETSVVPVILSAVGGIPTPVQGDFPGVPNRGWEMRLARWSVVGPINQVQFLTTDGPGDSIGFWGRDAYPLISNSDLGVPDLYSYFLPQFSRGPQPASVDGMNFVVLHPGIYTIKYSVLLREAETAAFVSAIDPYIRLRLPDGDSYAGFQLGVSTATQHGRATISEQFAVNSTPFSIEPRVFQASGATQAIDFRFKLARLAG